MSQIQRAIDQVCRARRYTENLLNHIDTADWFRQPHEGVTHVAWQVGHLAVAEYGLGLLRVRGERPDDITIVTREFRDTFGKGSQPTPNAADYPSATAIRGRAEFAVFDDSSFTFRAVGAARCAACARAPAASTSGAES